VNRVRCTLLYRVIYKNLKLGGGGGIDKCVGGEILLYTVYVYVKAENEKH